MYQDPGWANYLGNANQQPYAQEPQGQSAAPPGAVVTHYPNPAAQRHPVVEAASAPMRPVSSAGAVPVRQTQREAKPGKAVTEFDTKHDARQAPAAVSRERTRPPAAYASRVLGPYWW